MARVPSIFECAFARASVQRLGDVSVVVLSGEGAVVSPTLALRSVERWAGSRASTGVPRKDLALVLDRLEPRLARAGCALGCAGSPPDQVRLLRAAQQAGLEPKDWPLGGAAKMLWQEMAAKPPAPPVRNRDACDVKAPAGCPAESESPDGEWDEVLPGVRIRRRVVEES